MAGDGDEEWTNGRTDQSGGSGHETTKYKGKIVTWGNAMLNTALVNSQDTREETYPDRTDSKSRHATLESRLFSFLCDPLINALSQPNVRLHVPRIEQHLEILGKFDIEHADVGSSIPKCPALLVVPGESETSKNRGTLDENMGQWGLCTPKWHVRTSLRVQTA